MPRTLHSALISVGYVATVGSILLGLLMLGMVAFVAIATTFDVAGRAVLQPALLVALGAGGLHFLRKVGPAARRPRLRMSRNAGLVIMLLAVGVASFAPVEGVAVAGTTLVGATPVACQDNQGDDDDDDCERAAEHCEACARAWGNGDFGDAWFECMRCAAAGLQCLWGECEDPDDMYCGGLPPA